MASQSARCYSSCFMFVFKHVHYTCVSVAQHALNKGVPPPPSSSPLLSSPLLSSPLLFPSLLSSLTLWKLGGPPLTNEAECSGEQTSFKWCVLRQPPLWGRSGRLGGQRRGPEPRRALGARRERAARRVRLSFLSSLILSGEPQVVQAGTVSGGLQW